MNNERDVVGENSKIEWTDATWNPWQGCTKISPACEHCYMFTDLKRYGRDGSIVVRSKPPTFNLPLKKKRGGEFAIAPGSKVFTCSWSDWFHKAADPWRPEAWEIIRQRPDVIFQIVTKRVDRIVDHLPADWGEGWPNVWIIATVENQEWADKRIRALIKTPAAVRGLSIEPLLGPVNLECALWNGECAKSSCAKGKVDWVIVGGESGPHARPMHREWVRVIRNQCVSSGTAFFFKQWGEWLPPENGAFWPEHRIGKKAAGRILDGREWNEFPNQVCE